MLSDWLLILILAVLMDVVVGEPREMFHPVVWIGRLAELMRRYTPSSNVRLYGALIVIVCVLTASILGFYAIILAGRFHYLLGLAVAAYLLKSTFSISALIDVSGLIQRDISTDALQIARKRLPALVSRETLQLSKLEVVSAVIESLAENFVDSILSPLFFYVLLGVPGALAYKAVNTLDSIIGYKDGEYYKLGFTAAKMDDILNFIPARLSVVLIALAALPYKHAKDVFSICRRDCSKTQSPNSGWSISAMSGALNKRLSKPMFYSIGDCYPPAGEDDIASARIIVSVCSAISLLVLTSVGLVFNLSAVGGFLGI